MALVEAAAAGLLCVSTAVGGVPEVPLPCFCAPSSPLQHITTTCGVFPSYFPRPEYRIELNDQ